MLLKFHNFSDNYLLSVEKKNKKFLSKSNHIAALHINRLIFIYSKIYPLGFVYHHKI